VIFYDAKKAAQKVNEVYDDIENWWQQEVVQKARKEWVYQYARADKNWKWDWIKTLLRL